MSYINEALKKAQKNKDAGHIDYMRTMGKAGGTERFSDKRLIYISVIIIFIFLILLYIKIGDPFGRKPESLRKTAEAVKATDSSQNNKNLPVISEKSSPVKKAAEIDTSKADIISQREALYKQAASLFEKGRIQEAKDIYTKILSQDPGHINSLNDMGVLAMKQGEYKDAINYLEKAVRLKPDYVTSYYNLACAYSLLNDPDKGMDYLLKAITIDKKVKDWAEKDPDLRNIVESARFKVLIR